MTADLDAMLEALEAEEGRQETETGEAAPRESSVMKQLRAEIKRRDAALKKAEERASESEARLAARVEADNASALKSAGFSPRQAEAFQKLYGDVTPENVAAFRTEVLGTTAAPSEGADGEASSEFAPTGATGGLGLGDKPLSRAEFEELFLKDQAKAREALAAGRVSFRTG